MKEIRKITTGYVVQRWDAKTKEFLGQEFHASSEVDVEDEDGNSIDIGDYFDNENNCSIGYVPFDMVQKFEEEKE